MMKSIIALFILASVLLFITTRILAQTVMITMYKVAPKGHGSSIGTIQLTDTKYGMLITPRLHDIPAGIHGLHVHARSSCDNDGKAAGGHLDPYHTGKHLGPYNDDGHLGDLPALTVARDGKATLPVLAPRVRVSQVVGHALIFHTGGDNYSDSPLKLGGGGGRLACGIIAKNNLPHNQI